MFGRMGPQGTDNSNLFTCTISYSQLRVFDNHARNDSSLAYWSQDDLSMWQFYSCAITDNYVAVIDGGGELSVMSYDGTSWQRAPVLSLDNSGLGSGTWRLDMTDTYLAAVEENTALFAFENSGGTWSSTPVLSVSSGFEANSDYGCSIQMTDSFIIVGAKKYGTEGYGGAYIYSFSSLWSSTAAEIVPPSSVETDYPDIDFDNWGTDVAISGNYLAITNDYNSWNSGILVYK